MGEMPDAVREPAARMKWLRVAAAILMMGAFFVWLTTNGTRSSVPIAEEAPEGAATATPITLAELATDAAAYLGRTLRLDAIEVTGLMGRQSFWTVLPNGTPYLVKLDATLVQAGIVVQDGERLTVSGRVVEMTDSVIAAWERRGAIADEGERAQAQFAMTFIEASEALPVAPSASETPDDGAAA